MVIVYDTNGMILPIKTSYERAMEMIDGGRALEVERYNGLLVSIKKLPGFIKTKEQSLSKFETILKEVAALATTYTGIIQEKQSSLEKESMYVACKKKIVHALSSTAVSHRHASDDLKKDEITMKRKIFSAVPEWITLHNLKDVDNAPLTIKTEHAIKGIAFVGKGLTAKACGDSIVQIAKFNARCPESKTGGFIINDKKTIDTIIRDFKGIGRAQDVVKYDGAGFLSNFMTAEAMAKIIVLFNHRVLSRKPEYPIEMELDVATAAIRNLSKESTLSWDSIATLLFNPELILNKIGYEYKYDAWIKGTIVASSRLVKTMGKNYQDAYIQKKILDSQCPHLAPLFSFETPYRTMREDIIEAGKVYAVPNQFLKERYHILCDTPFLNSLNDFFVSAIKMAFQSTALSRAQNYDTWNSERLLLLSVDSCGKYSFLDTDEYFLAEAQQARCISLYADQMSERWHETRIHQNLRSAVFFSPDAIQTPFSQVIAIAHNIDQNDIFDVCNTLTPTQCVGMIYAPQTKCLPKVYTVV